MYDFNPLSSLFLMRSLSADLPLPSFRGLLAKLKRGRRPAPAPDYLPTPPLHSKPACYDRAFPWPASASHPSYNLTSPVPTDVPTHP